MDRRELVTIGVVFLLIIGGAVGYFVSGGRDTREENVMEAQIESPAVPGKVVYSPEIPVFAELTKPKMERVIESNLMPTARERFFDMSAQRGGFFPNALTVQEGDSVVIDFTAADGAYDFDIPYLGAYFSPMTRGETKQLIFDIPSGTHGTFMFQCRSACPSRGAIEGSLIVMPQ